MSDSSSRSNEDTITLQDLVDGLRRILVHWPVLVLSVSIGLAVAFLYNRYTANVYKVQATVAVEETENPLAASIDGMLNLGLGFGGNGIVDTRIAILKSYAHNIRVARELNLGVALYNKGRLNKREIYKPSHFSIEFDREHNQLVGVEFSLSFDENDFELELEQVDDHLSVYNYAAGEEVNSTNFDLFAEGSSRHNYNTWIENPLYRFKVVRGPNLEDFIRDRSYTSSSFEFVPYNEIVNWVIDNLETESNDKQQSSLLTMELEGPLVLKLADYLNTSIKELQAYELREKNLMAINTIDFIDSQLIQIEHDLK
ncbi:MAG: hypothetical protein ACPG59_06390, partial [Flavobacteriaceae bacterium]